MDAVEYVKQRNRMCDYCPSCSVCPAGDLGGCSTVNGAPIVEQWAKEHPVKTRQSELLKLFPNVRLESDGMPSLCPIIMDKTKGRPDGMSACCIIRDSDKCYSCRRDFWLKEIE